MGRLRYLMKAAAGAAFLVAVVGCDDEIPTAVGKDLFPDGASPTTVEVILPAAQYLDELGRFGDFTEPKDADLLLVAHDFGGVLEAHVLARFSGFPTSIDYTADGMSLTDSSFVYGAGRVVAPIDSVATETEGPLTLQLWSLAQEWDPESATWELAIDTAGARMPWTEPGGTQAELLSQVVRAPGDTLTQDSIVWAVDSLAVAAMADPAFAGLVVTATGASGRIQLGRMTLRTTVRPESRPDTAIAQDITSGPQELVFNPQEPAAPASGPWQIGGLRSSRVMVRINLPDSVPGCMPTEGGAGSCPPVPLHEVQINEAALLLEPVAVADGFRPLEPLTLSLRVVGEPELGREAPLGGPIAAASVPPRRFQAADSLVALSIAQYVQSRVPADSTTIAVSLLTEPAAASFGVARFDSEPRLRLLYTLPLNSEEP